MNIRSTSHIVLLLSSIAVLLLLMTSCHKAIYSDLSECPQGVHFRFLEQNRCVAAPTYPEDIKEVRIFAFDEKGVLLAHWEAKGLRLSAEFFMEQEYLHIGKSTFVAWGGSDLSKYDFGKFSIGSTTKEQMMVELLKKKEVMGADVSPIYVGVPKEGTLTQEDRSKVGSIFDSITFNMHQISNEFNFTLHGVREGGDYDLYIEGDNTKYHIDGSFADGASVRYVTKVEMAGTTLKANFKTLKLAKDRSLRLVLIDRLSNEEVYSANLIQDLLLYSGSGANGNPPYDLECQHLFNIEMTLDLANHVALAAKINDWNIVFRDIELH